VDLRAGATVEHVRLLRTQYGKNSFPETSITPYYKLLMEALSDSTLIVLLIAATVSLILGLTTQHEGEENKWIEGVSIYFAVILVSNITASNDYTKQLQFRDLENTSQKDELISVIRENTIQRINPIELVVGDVLVLQVGDQVPADAILINEQSIVEANEASLSGEPDDIRKSYLEDPFLLSSSLITSGEEIRALVIGIGRHSQWGKIKANLIVEPSQTPLQAKLEKMTKQIGMIGVGAAICTFVALLIKALILHSKPAELAIKIIDAFILSVTIVVVAIPEGLPLAVTISLAYSTKKMYNDKCFIRVLAACETMGNVTNICSDKTGTLTENRMTVVEGWFVNCRFDSNTYRLKFTIPRELKYLIAENCSINRSAYVIYSAPDGTLFDRPQIIGNKTEAALILMLKTWGFDYEVVKNSNFNEATDKLFSFNSDKKRSSAILFRSDKSVRVYVKGATEMILNDASYYLNRDGKVYPMTRKKKTELESIISQMASAALRTIALGHRDFPNKDSLPSDWQENCPDTAELCVDAIIGIIDPLRDDVVEAVRIAQEAGIVVRMITGDNIDTAKAIAAKCGILTENGIAIEGPDFRKMTLEEVDKILPTIQIMARSSPEDKLLLVTRLNGFNLPKNQDEWEKKYFDRPTLTWKSDRDKVLPGYSEEWGKKYPGGGHVVAVTGDGTNDAPALMAADVGLSMGLTGTKVAQGASDIVILDDRFNSIVRAIMWGRAVYDNIRKFLQFQLTVNLVALILVFIGACAGIAEPLTAVQMLWVNLVMDTLGALALGTELPTQALLQRKPYKRDAGLISKPMWRFIFCQGVFQLFVCFVIMFEGHNLFLVNGEKLITGEPCYRYGTKKGSYDMQTALRSPAASVESCSIFKDYCDGSYQEYCLRAEHKWSDGTAFTFPDSFASDCLKCEKLDYTHSTLIFNAFIFCQIFNELNARVIGDDKNMLQGILTNIPFLCVFVLSSACQIFMVFVGDEFVKTTPLSGTNFIITIIIGSSSLIIGFLSRFIKVTEDPDTFFTDPFQLKLEGEESALLEGVSTTHKEAFKIDKNQEEIKINTKLDKFL
jgi:calcium-translocating P-type ATPase